MAVRLLHKQGQTVRTVVTGRAVLAALAQPPFDLVLLDVRMPAMDGLAVTAAISIPAGFTQSGMPVGWHLATRPMDEATLFRVCHAYQRATDHHQKHPPMGEKDFGAHIL